MAASVIEQILARVKAVLLGATAAGQRVYRSRDDAFAVDELPAINIRRAGTTHDEQDLGNSVFRVAVEFTLEIHVAQAADPETAADAIHQAAHAALLADATLLTYGKASLTCTGTDLQTGTADRLATLLSAQYQLYAWAQHDNLTTFA